ncbi:SpoIIE domain-containing protein [Butyrivibrio hungatei]|uniref:SpoIIE domain-containing protein n=2 Tax=Butyrivibrio hungatei TaxID=185008 RepID=A0A1D9P5L3_9FIRM|nr:SpoIIE domain-containing protein [Butyrivibrio hungatei]
MADVSGKGVPAALFMVNAKTLIKNRTMTSNNLSTSEIIHDVNNMLCEGNDAEMFVTVWLCIIQLSTGNCRITNAGHEHPAVKVSGQDYSLKTYRHSIAVAAMPDVKFEEHEFKLNPGDSLFVYTDGVTEATDSENDLFGTDRLIASLNKEKDADATALLGLVKKDIDAFVGNAPQFDDITMLCFRYLGK